MGSEWKAEQYTGKGYLNRPGVYQKHIPLYKRVSTFLPTKEKCEPILDLGCGVGFFAKYLNSVGYKDYTGIDFSKQMIAHAKTLVPNYNFVCGDLRHPDIYKLFKIHKIFTCLETLEHIIDDIPILKQIPSGSNIVGSVPSSDFASHVRFFKNENIVRNRYKNVIEFKDLITIKLNPKKPKNKIFIFSGAIK